MRQADSSWYADDPALPMRRNTYCNVRVADATFRSPTDNPAGTLLALSESVYRAISFFFFKQKTAYEIGLGIPAEPLFRSPTYQRRAPLRLPLVPRNGCGRPGRAPERFLPLDITSLLLHVIFDARFLLRQ